MRQYDYTRGEKNLGPQVEAPTRSLTGPGETAIKNAPVLRLSGGESCIPQHFLRYEHSIETVEAVAAKISYDARYPIFVSSDTGGLYLQIGIVGPDNYKQSKDKLVYGRKWRVEPNLPTSEIIQTAFLAIKKAREHELRERFVVISDGCKTTPFNSHHDLPHMARNSQCFTRAAPKLSLDAIIQSVKYDGVKFKAASVTPLPNGQTVVIASPQKAAESEFGTLCNDGISFICDDLTPSAVLSELFAACLQTSDRHVETHFAYDGFARFSRDVNILEVADLSSKQRQCPTSYLPSEDAAQFIGQLKSENYETDETRIPVLSGSRYNTEICAQLRAMNVSPPPIKA